MARSYPAHKTTARPLASLTAPYRRHNGAYRRTSSVVVRAVAGVVALGWQLVSVLCLMNSARSAQISHNSREVRR